LPIISCLYINKSSCLSPSGSSIGCKPRFMKQKSQVRIPLLLSLRGHAKKKKKKKE
jgi:hypothetical protein